MTCGSKAPRRGGGRYQVAVRVAAGKSSTDGRGMEQPAVLNERIEIAVTGEEKVLSSRRFPLRNGMNEITILVDGPPSSVTVDPWITRVDRNPLDNSKRF